MDMKAFSPDIKWKVFLPDTEQTHESEVAVVHGDLLNLDNHTIKDNYTMLLALDRIHRIVLEDDITTESSYDMRRYPDNVALISLLHTGKPLPAIVHLLMDKTKRKDFAVWLIVMLQRIDKHTADWEETIEKLQRISDSRMSIDFSDSKTSSRRRSSTGYSAASNSFSKDHHVAWEQEEQQPQTIENTPSTSLKTGKLDTMDSDMDSLLQNNKVQKDLSASQNTRETAAKLIQSTWRNSREKQSIGVHDIQHYQGAQLGLADEGLINCKTLKRILKLENIEEIYVGKMSQTLQEMKSQESNEKYFSIIGQIGSRQKIFDLEVVDESVRRSVIQQITQKLVDMNLMDPNYRRRVHRSILSLDEEGCFAFHIRPKSGEEKRQNSTDEWDVKSASNKSYSLDTVSTVLSKKRLSDSKSVLDPESSHSIFGNNRRLPQCDHLRNFRRHQIELDCRSWEKQHKVESSFSFNTDFLSKKKCECSGEENNIDYLTEQSTLDPCTAMEYDKRMNRCNEMIQFDGDKHLIVASKNRELNSLKRMVERLCADNEKLRQCREGEKDKSRELQKRLCHVLKQNECFRDKSKKDAKEQQKLSSELDLKKKDIRRLRNDLKKSKKTHTAETKQFQKLIVKQKDEVKALNVHIDAQNKQIGKLQNGKKTLMAQVNSLQCNVKRLKSVKEKLKKMVMDSKRVIDTKDGEIKNLNDNLCQIQAELRVLLDLKEKWERMECQYKQKHQDIKEQSHEMEKMVGGARLENENLKFEIRRLQRAIKPKDRDIERLKAKLQENDKINASLQCQKKENEDLLKVIEDKDIEIETLQEKQRETSKSMNRIKQEMGTKEKHLRKTLQELQWKLQNSNKEHDAIQNALHAELQHLQKQKDETVHFREHIDAQNAEIEKLHLDNKRLQCDANCLGTIKEKLRESKLELIRVIDTKDGEIRNLKNQRDKLEEDLSRLYDDHQTSIAAVRDQEAEIRQEMELQFKQEQRRSKKQTEQRLKEMRRFCKEMERRVDEAKSGNDNLEDEIGSLSAKLHANMEWKAKLIQVLSRQNEEFEKTMDQEVEKINRLQQQLSDRMDFIQCDVNQMESKKEELQDAVLNGYKMRRVIAEKNDEIRILTEQKEKLKDSLSKVNDREYELQQAMENKERECKELELQLKQQGEMEFKEVKRKFEEIEKRVSKTVLENQDLKRESQRFHLEEIEKLRMESQVMRQSLHVQREVEAQNAMEMQNTEELLGLMDNVMEYSKVHENTGTMQSDGTESEQIKADPTFTESENDNGTIVISIRDNPNRETINRMFSNSFAVSNSG